MCWFGFALSQPRPWQGSVMCCARARGTEELHLGKLSWGQCFEAQDCVVKGKAVALCFAQARLLGAARLLRLFGFKDTVSCSGLWEPTSVWLVTSAARVILLCWRQMPYLFGWSEPLIPNSGSASEGERPDRYDPPPPCPHRTTLKHLIPWKPLSLLFPPRTHRAAPENALVLCRFEQS